MDESRNVKQVKNRVWNAAAKLFAAAILGSFGVFWVSISAQTQPAQIRTLVQEIQWLDPALDTPPIGNFAPLDGFFVESIPFGGWTVETGGAWSGAEVLMEGSVWLAIPEEDLLPEQKSQLADRPEPLSIQAFPMHLKVQVPLLRRNAASGDYERLQRLDLTLGSSPLPVFNGFTNRQSTWPETSPLAEGQFVKIATDRSGVHRIDETFLAELGLDPDTIDPRRMVLYGNGGEQLPLVNAVPRPLGLLTTAMLWTGEEADSSFLGNGQFLFYAQGPDFWTYNAEGERYEHTKHSYSDSSFYFLRLDAPFDVPLSRVDLSAIAPGVFDGNVVDHHRHHVFHEKEANSPNRSGREFFGDWMGPGATKNLSLGVPFAREEPGRVTASVMVNSVSVASTVRISVGDEELPLTPTATGSSSTSNVANPATSTRTGNLITGSGANSVAAITLEFEASNGDAEAWLDYVAVEQPADLRFSGTEIVFDGTTDTVPDLWTTYEVQADGGLAWVWDVTDPCQPVPRPIESVDGTTDRWQFQAPIDTLRTFVAWAGFGARRPAYSGRPANSNLHALDSLDWVIVTVPAYVEEAMELALIHAEEGLRGAVVTQQAVFNEFSSGSPDPTAIKMLMQMLMDRADAAQDTTLRPRYLQLYGDGTFVNRNLPQNSPYVITYQSANSISPTGSYVSDDYFGFLGAEYGEGLGDQMAIGVGRIPCSSKSEAADYLAKIKAYLHSDGLGSGSCAVSDTLGRFGNWRNRIVFVADDMDGNSGPSEKIHMVHSDSHADGIRENHNDYNVSKIYLDAYPQSSTPGGERYPDAEAEIDRQVADGALIMNYIGHGGERGWAHERVLDNTTIQEWTNLASMPLFMTATCELARFDDPEVETAGELTVMNPEGGAIAMLTTTRVVFSGGNQQLNTAFYKHVFDESYRLGDISRLTKNDPGVSDSPNKRNFSLLGDVALRLAYPELQVIATEFPDTLRALDVVTIKGQVTDNQGNVLEGFNGLVYPEVYDKMSSVTTLNNDGAATPYVYEVFRNVLHRGVAEVIHGEFSFEFSVPADINQTFGAGRLSFYATDGERDAHGHTEEFVVGGFNPDAPVDNDPPEISLFLNDTNFVAGGLSNASPVLVARLQDVSGINASGLGIGHDIKVVLDGASDDARVLNSFYTADLNTYVSGTVRYPLGELAPGEHTLDFVAWDVANNKGSASLTFTVSDGQAIELAQFTSYPNPTMDAVTFRFEHNLACAIADVYVEVTDLTGRRVAGLSTTMEPSGFRSQPVTWDLRSSVDGRPVAGGTYLASMKITAEDGSVAQYTDKILVLRP